jgi:hypothetical protein
MVCMVVRDHREVERPDPALPEPSRDVRRRTRVDKSGLSFRRADQDGITRPTSRNSTVVSSDPSATATVASKAKPPVATHRMKFFTG